MDVSIPIDAGEKGLLTLASVEGGDLRLSSRQAAATRCRANP